MKKSSTHTSPANGAANDINEADSEQQITEFLASRQHLRVRQGIFTVCFILLCLIDLLLGMAPGETHNLIIKCTGLVIAAIILNHDSEIEDHSIPTYVPYAGWIILFLFGVRHYALQLYGPDIADVFGWLTGYGKNPLAGSLELAEWIVLVCNIGVYGIIVIRTVMEYVLNRKLPRINWPHLGIWSILLTGMLLSQNESLWPLSFLILFGCFYFTEYSKEEMTCLINGMLNGIIAAFFIFLVFSSLFRAFDTEGYCGLYTQYTKNALFYLCAHTAFLGKWFQFHRTGAGRIWKALAMVCIGFVTGYGILTTVRHVIVLMLVNTLITVAFLSLADEKKRIQKALTRFAAVVALIVLLTPCAYWIARHMPDYYTSPLIYSTDNYDRKVQRYRLDLAYRFTSPEALRKELIGQFFRFDDPDRQEWKENQIFLRKEILAAYSSELNFSGHSNAESSFWITDWYFAQHSQNIFLHMAFCYGIPVGFLFIAFYILVGVFLLLRCLKKKSSDWWYYTGLLFLISVLSYGCFDRNWQVGQLPFTLLFLVTYLTIHRTVKKKK